MSEPVADNSKMKRNLTLLGLSGTIGAVALFALFALWRANPDIAYWQGLLVAGRTYLEANPWALVLALMVLPGIGFPVSPLLVLFGVVLGPRFGMPLTCVIGVCAHSICSAWFYFLAAGPLRGFLKRSVLKNRPLPAISGGNALRLGFMIRMAPGLPYPIQNIALGVMGLRFGTYLLVSVPTTSIYTIGFIVTGGALFQGKAGLALTGIFLIVVVLLATRMWMKRAKTKSYAR